MKKQNLIDAVVDWFQSDQAGEQKKLLHPEIVKVHISNFFNEIIYNVYINGKKFSDFSQLDAWSRYYECTVQGLVGTNAYAFLPFAPIQLPDNAGIREVRDHDDPTNVFAPVEATSNPIFAELEVNDFDDTPTYHTEQNNLFAGAGESSHMLRLGTMPTGVDAVTSIDVLMVTGPEQIDDYDDMVMPAGMEETIVKQVIDFMLNKPKSDEANDMVTKSNTE